ncbi:unnamed protein product [Trichogramma brassicae]|uniref:Uncharacterized protein n=1 Tax=Trichogramma brassicae TaxID=86971 RepID=A0A6H5I362_9HYME|nr:unnamed protein product [Trichogramma brassicae]
MELPCGPVKVGVCPVISSTTSRAESASRRATPRARSCGLSALAVAASPRTPSSSVPRADRVLHAFPQLQHHSAGGTTSDALHRLADRLLERRFRVQLPQDVGRTLFVPAALTTIASGLRRTLRCRGLEGCEPRSTSPAWWASRRRPRSSFHDREGLLADCGVVVAVKTTCSCAWGRVARFSAATTSAAMLRAAFFSFSRTAWRQPPLPSCEEERERGILAIRRSLHYSFGDDRHWGRRNSPSPETTAARSAAKMTSAVFSSGSLLLESACRSSSPADMAVKSCRRRLREDRA